MTVQAGELLRRDVHPAELLMPDGSVETGLRVFVTSHRLLAYRATADRRIELAVDLVLEEPFSVEANRSTLMGALQCVTASGQVTVNRGRGCGCGSPLKGLGSPVPWIRKEQ